MAESAAAPGLAVHGVVVRDTPRHSTWVRVTHWTSALCFVVLVVSGMTIRYLHFLSAWVSVFTGLVYVTRGLLARHFSRKLLPARGELTLGAIRRVIGNHLRFKPSSEDELASYNVLQRLSYTGVVFVLFPLMIWTGLAMSPAVTSATAWARGHRQRAIPGTRGSEPR